MEIKDILTSIGADSVQGKNTNIFAKEDKILGGGKFSEILDKYADEVKNTAGDGANNTAGSSKVINTASSLKDAAAIKALSMEIAEMPVIDKMLSMNMISTGVNNSKISDGNTSSGKFLQQLNKYAADAKDVKDSIINTSPGDSGKNIVDIIMSSINSAGNVNTANTFSPMDIAFLKEYLDKLSITDQVKTSGNLSAKAVNDNGMALLEKILSANMQLDTKDLEPKVKEFVSKIKSEDNLNKLLSDPKVLSMMNLILRAYGLSNASSENTSSVSKEKNNGDINVSEGVLGNIENTAKASKKDQIHEWYLRLPKDDPEPLGGGAADKNNNTGSFNNPVELKNAGVNLGDNIVSGSTVNDKSSADNIVEDIKAPSPTDEILKEISKASVSIKTNEKSPSEKLSEQSADKQELLINILKELRDDIKSNKITPEALKENILQLIKQQNNEAAVNAGVESTKEQTGEKVSIQDILAKVLEDNKKSADINAEDVKAQSTDYGLPKLEEKLDNFSVNTGNSITDGGKVINQTIAEQDGNLTNLQNGITADFIQNASKDDLKKKIMEALMSKISSSESNTGSTALKAETDSASGAKDSLAAENLSLSIKELEQLLKTDNSLDTLKASLITSSLDAVKADKKVANSDNSKTGQSKGSLDILETLKTNLTGSSFKKPEEKLNPIMNNPMTAEVNYNAAGSKAYTSAGMQDKPSILGELLTKDKEKDSHETKINNAVNFMSQLNSINDNKIPSEAVKDQTIDSKNMVKDLVKTVKFMENDGIKDLTVKIAPKELGEVVIKLTVENGVMKANITASNKEAYNILNSNIHELNNQLAEQNMRIQSFNVNVYNGDYSSLNQNFNQQFGQGRQSSRGSVFADTSEEDIIEETANHDGQVDILA